MTFAITVTVPDDIREFIRSRKLSPSSLLQGAVRALMLEERISLGEEDAKRQASKKGTK